MFNMDSYDLAKNMIHMCLYATKDYLNTIIVFKVELYNFWTINELFLLSLHKIIVLFIYLSEIFFRVSLIPLLLCFGPSTFIASALVFGTGLLYGLMSVGKK